MKIVVTGALGHIGSRFIRGLRPGEFDEVVLLDNLSTQRYPSLFNLPEGVPFRLVVEDILRSDLTRHFEGARAVVHLAAVTNAAGSIENRDEVERVNFQGTEKVARACASVGARLVFASTTSVYGTSSGRVDEDCPDSELRPQSPYADSKLAAEKLLASLGGSHGLRFTVCRLGTIFGPSPGMRFHTAVNKFIWQAMLGEPVEVWSTAMHQMRPYLDVSDAERALRLILAEDLFTNRTYNVLTENYTVARILEVLRKYVPNLTVRETNSPIMNQLSYTVACEKFRACGFQAEGDLDRGIRETLNLLEGIRAKLA